MTEKTYRYLFGPVPSRRLGRSMGVDLVPFKVCSFDCIYCQLGCTTTKTVERKEWVPTDEVIQEVRDWFGSGNTADAITLAGSGEPTLHSRFGEILQAIREVSPVRRVLLSNGSLFHLPEVRKGAALADVVKVTLSASDEVTWNRIHRQASGLKFQDMIEGLNLFRRDFAGEIWLEVMVLGDINSLESEIRRIADLAQNIHPDRVQLNTTVRPPADSSARPVNPEKMERLAQLFDPVAEVIGKYHAGEADDQKGVSSEQILAMLQRHPCSLEEIAGVFGISAKLAMVAIRRLEETGAVKALYINGISCYVAASPGSWASGN